MTEQSSRADRRHPGHENLPPVPAVRGKTVGMIGRADPVPQITPPRDMRPKRVDRAKIKQARAASRRNRRKR